MATAASIPYKFATPWAADAAGGFVTPVIPATASGASASQQLGYPPITQTSTGAGGIAPYGADANGLGLYLSSWAQWQQMGGPIKYDATLSGNIGGYPSGALLFAAAATNWWLSTVDNNTSDPDTGGGNWTNVPILSGFGSGLQAVSSTGTINATSSGNVIEVGGSATTQTISNSGWSGGNTLIFFAGANCTVATTGGPKFYGPGLFALTTSITMPFGTCFGVMYDGDNWIVTFASPNLYVPAPTLGNPWIRYNADGTIEQGARITIPTGDGDLVTFPTPFPNGIMDIQVTDWGNGCERPGWTPNGSSTSTFLAFARMGNESFTDMRYGYRAIGW